MAAFAPTSATQGIWQLEQIYIGYYGRAVDASGYNYWQNEYNQRISGTYKIGSVNQPRQSSADAIASIASSFGASGQAETVALYPFLGSALTFPTTDNVVKTQITSFVTSVYQNLFNRAPDATGLTYWTNQIAAGTVSTSVAILAIGNAAGDDNSTQSLADKAVLNNKIAVSDNFLVSTSTNGIGVSGTVPASVLAQARAILVGVDGTAASVTNAATAQSNWVATGAGTPGQTYTLTTGVDNGAAFTGTAGSDIFNAVDTSAGAQTWTALDALNGGLGNDTFNVASSTAISVPAGATVTGIEVMNVTEAGSAATVTLNTTTFSGLTTLAVTNSGTGTDTITAAATTSVADTHSVGGAAVIDGGLNVAVTKAQSVAGNTVMGVITVGGTTAPAGTVTVTNADTITASTGGANTTSQITVTGGNGVTITDTVNSIVTNTATAVTYTQKGANGAVVINNNTNVTTTGAAIALTGNGVTVNGSATATDAGATTITVNNTATATQVAVTPSTITQGAVGITGGTATTAVTVNQSSTATAAATVAAVAGVAAVTAVAAAPGTKAITAVTAVTPVKAVAGNVGVVAGAVTISDVNGASTTAANTIATVSLAAIGGTSSITSSALTTLNLSGVSGNTPTLTITDNLTANTTANVLNLNTTAATGNVAITAAKVGTLNITNSGTSALGAFTDTNLKTVTVAGSGVITLGANSATTETVTGSAGVTQTIDNTVVTYNASGTTGTSKITTSTTGTKVITAGSGTADELVLSANSTWTATTGGKFVGFEVLSLGAVNITQDASVFGAGINKLNLAASAGTAVISKMNTGASINVAAAATATTSLTVGYADTTGASDVTTITFAGASTVPQTGVSQTISTLVLADANGVGIGTLNIVDNNLAFNYAGDNIATLTDTNVSALNFSGVGGFTLGGTAFTNNATSMTIGNTGTNAAGAIVTMTDNSLGNLTFTGTGKTLLNLTDTVAGTLNITNSGTGSVTVTDGGANTVAANINLTGAMTATLTDANLTSLALSAGQEVTLTAAATSGITISGAADNSRVALTLGAAAATKTNTVTLGNGNNSIVDRTTAGTSTITVGTGSNLIDVGVFAGTNNSTGLFNVTTGTHALPTVGNEIIVGTAGTNFATVAAYTLTGLTTGDQVAFKADAASISSGSQAATSLTGAANVAGALNTLQTAAATLHSTAWGVYGGDTYVVENATGTNGAQATTVVLLKGLSSTTTGALSFTNGGFTIGSTNSAIAIDSGASKAFALATSQTFTSAYSGTYTITQTAGAAGSVTLTGATASGSIDLTGGTGTSTINVSGTSGAFTAITGGAGVDTISTGTGTAVITGAAGNDTITLGATGTTVQKVVFSGGVIADAAAVAAQVTANGVDTINGWIATDTINVSALGDGTTGQAQTAITAAGLQGALTSDRSIVISTSGAAANLTTASATTIALADFTAATLTNLAAYLSERLTVTASAQHNVLVINDTAAGVNKTFVYTLSNVGNDTTIDAADIALVGIINNGGNALATANVVFA